MNSFPDQIQRLEPAICCGFIAHLPPNPLLGIEPRLVRRKIGETDPLMGSQEGSNLFAFMPFGAIDIQPDLISLKLTIKLPETIEESIPVTLGTSQHSHLAQQGCNPTEDIQSFLMLTGGEHPQSAANLAPSSAKTRVQCKTCLIFKDDGLLSCQRSEFFLKCDEISSHLRPAPADTCTLIVSSGSPVDASTTGPDVPSGVFQIDFSSGPPRSDHPTGLGSDQIPQATSPDALPIRAELLRSTEPVVQVSSRVSGTLDLFHSPCASTSSSSDASSRAPQLSIPDADPPTSAEAPQSLFQRRLPGFPELLSTDGLGLLLDEPMLNLVFS